MSSSNKAYKSKVKRRYNKLNKDIKNDPAIKASLVKHNKAYDDAMVIIKELEIYKKEYNDLVSTIVPENVAEALPIETLRDFLEIKRFGKTSKFKFKDLHQVNFLKYVQLDFVEDNHETIINSKIAYIDLLQSKIDYLIKLAGK